ncbi:hypothetical protein VP01_762g2 [Puccinia sorghi]|uniref:Uncharacterized protein n=1 Tax=Puccinia sorghi TaxID=27349 RepID=A0A0L6UBS4_9BASI|nr:hypothetical protein VP01_762g2 [Puccinia sorghi]
MKLNFYPCFFQKINLRRLPLSPSWSFSPELSSFKLIQYLPPPFEPSIDPSPWSFCAKITLSGIIMCHSSCYPLSFIIPWALKKPCPSVLSYCCLFFDTFLIIKIHKNPLNIYIYIYNIPKLKINYFSTFLQVFVTLLARGIKLSSNLPSKPIINPQPSQNNQVPINQQVSSIEADVCDELIDKRLIAGKLVIQRYQVETRHMILFTLVQHQHHAYPCGNDSSMCLDLFFPIHPCTYILFFFVRRRASSTSKSSYLSSALLSLVYIPTSREEAAITQHGHSTSLSLSLSEKASPYTAIIIFRTHRTLLRHGFSLVALSVNGFCITHELSIEEMRIIIHFSRTMNQTAGAEMKQFECYTPQISGDPLKRPKGSMRLNNSSTDPLYVTKHMV